jgi:predicted RNase H-like HicB family nuclease
MINYQAAYYRDPDSGGYTAKVLDFPGVLSQGRSLDQARKMLSDALREMTEWLLEDGQALPRPDPAAADAAADVVEPIQLIIRARSGSAS